MEILTVKKLETEDQAFLPLLFVIVKSLFWKKPCLITDIHQCQCPFEYCLKWLQL